MPLFIGWMLDAMLERGEFEEARRELKLSGLDGAVPDELSYTPILLSRAWISIGQGKHADALRDLEEIGRRETRSGTAYFSWNADMAIVLSALGKPAAARPHAEAGLARARRWGASAAIGRALRAQAITIGGEAGIELLREASELLRGSPTQLERLHVLVDLGVALRRARHRTQAREPLREALQLARRGGALALARRAHEELAATGEKLPPLSLVGPRSLTPSERRIAELAAAGLTNREIAQTLFVSIKTVESHLRGAYRKLDVTSREQLGPALASGS
jgi:DNA-binding CsgD family transcriptional regulator